MAAVGLAVGCGEKPEISHYTVPRDPPEALRQVDRMLGAIIEDADQLWFFKLVGPTKEVSEVRSAFESYLKSLTFTDGQPQWQLPEGWKQLPGDGIRFASIDVPLGRTSRLLSVTKLPSQGDWERDVIDNVQRWRGQLGLEPSSEPMAGAVPIAGFAAERSAAIVDLEGKPGGSGLGMPGLASQTPTPPFAGSSTMPAPSGATASPPSGSRPFTSTAPEDWRPGRMGPMRLAAYQAGPEASPAEVTVIEARGDDRGNVSRWLGQISSAVKDEQVEAILAAREPLQIGDVEAGLFRLEGDQGSAITAVIIPWTDGSSLFIKMQGPMETVKQQDDALKQFAQSLKW